MSIWVTGSLEVRNSSDELVFQVGDSTNNAPTSFKSAQVTGSFEVVSDPVYAHNILSASWDFVNEGPRLSVGTGSPINVALGVGGDLGLSDTVSDTRLTVVGTNSYLNVGSDNNNRGFMLWENGSKRLRFGTKETGNNYFSSLIVKTGSLDVDNNLSIGGNTSTDGTFHARDNISTDGTLQLGVGRILAPDGGTSITIDNDDNVGVIGSLQVGGNVIKASDGGSTITMDTDDNVTIAGRLSVAQGITSNPAVRVSTTNSGGSHDQWIKIADNKGTLGSQQTTFASFLVVFAGNEWSNNFDGDFAYIVNVKFTPDGNASPYYQSIGTYITVEPLHAGNLEGFDPTSDIAITFDNGALPTDVELWVKSKEQFKECFVAYLGGTNNPDGDRHDTGFEILTGESWSASITSLGQEVYGQYVDKVFEHAHVEGNLNVTGSLEFLGASEINSTAGLTINSTGTTLDGANVTVSDDLVVNGGNVFINKTTTSAEADVRLRTYYTDDISAGDNVGAVSFWGSENGTDWQQMAYILAEADENFTHGSNFGSRIKFGTAPNGGTLTHQVEIDNAGNLITDGSVLVSGSLKLDSLIEDSAGNTVITLPGDGNTVFEGTIVANGDTIEDSGNNIVMRFDGSGNIDYPTTFKGASHPMVTIANTSNTDSIGARLDLRKVPADNSIEGDDVLGQIQFRGEESGNVRTSMVISGHAASNFTINNNTNDSVPGYLTLNFSPGEGSSQYIPEEKFRFAYNGITGSMPVSLRQSTTSLGSIGQRIVTANVDVNDRVENTHNEHGYVLNLKRKDNATGEEIGIGFGITTGTDVGAAITHERKGSNSQGAMHFRVKPTTGGGNLLDTAMTIDGSAQKIYSMYIANNQTGVSTNTLYPKVNTVTGELIAYTSDARVKKDVEDMVSNLETVCRLMPKKYRGIEEGDDAEKSVGLIAQEVESIIPDLVTNKELPEDVMRGVNYDLISMYIINALKEIKDRLEALENGN